ncbi:MAG: hypothetical protein WCA49_13190 [Candidatus Sulfotelmatobacter sp.]
MVTHLKKTVAFIQLQCEDGPNLLDVRGTGFFVFYPDDRVGKDQGFVYLITNRHVAMCLSSDHRPLTVRSIAIRLNRKDGTSGTIPLTTHGNIPWVLPSDESEDLAAIGLAPDQHIFDYLGIPMSVFGTKDVLAAHSVAEGERILFAGFFYQFPGVAKVQPIVREGILAMMPDEKLPTTTGKPGSVYLGDVHVFGGNSGAPVFCNLGGLRGNTISSGDDYHLLGVVSGMFYEDEEFNLEVTTTFKGTGRANSGISMIVPADAVKNLLDAPVLKAQREAAVAGIQRQADPKR